MATVSSLSSYFTNIISDLMIIERQPLTRMQQQRSSLNGRSSAYSSVKTYLSGMKDAVKGLLSTNYSSSLVAGRSASVSDVASGFSVLSASASSSAMAGTYEIHVNTLAQAHRVRSDRQVYADQALGLSGTILLGGAQARSIASDPPNTVTNESVTGFAVGSLAEEQTELGSGTYYVETRNDSSAGWQFRLVDGDGNAVSARLGDGESFGTNWQAVPTSGETYDTGRGLTIDFAQSGYQVYNRETSGVAKVAYTAQGSSIQVEATDSLNDIATAINDASFASGNGVTASVVDRQLVLSAADSGIAHTIRASDASGTVLAWLGILGADGGLGDSGAADGFKYTLQTALNASFTVNDLLVDRSKNQGLTDVISGVTLNLAADAEGKDATLVIAETWTGALSGVNTFVSKFNSTIQYIDAQTAITRSTSGSGVTYTRAALADDNIFSDLRMNLIRGMISEHTNSGIYDSLREIGLEVNDSLLLEVSDSSLLQSALSEHYDDVIKLVDTVMGGLDDTLGTFTGESGETGYLDSTIDLISNQIDDVDDDIANMNTYLTGRNEYLVQQYAEMQSTIQLLSYTQQMWASIYNSTANMYA
jgi:flagellar capping protein FliD